MRKLIAISVKVAVIVAVVLFAAALALDLLRDLRVVAANMKAGVINDSQ